MPKISVIVPVYNVEKYLEKCLESIVNQDFDSFEIIIINDGSTDQSADIALRYVSNYEMLIRLISQKNGGLGAARNTGIEHAKGDYILFVDSDDTIAPNTLKYLYDSAIQHNGDIVVFDYCIVDETGKQIAIKLGIKNSDNIVTCLEKRSDLILNDPSACNKLFKSALFNDYNIRFPGKVWFEDLRTTTKLFTFASSIVHCNKALYNYFQRTGSIMNNSNLNKNIEIVQALEDVIEFYKAHNLFEKYHEELEYLAIYHILLVGSARIIKVDYRHSLLEFFLQYVNRNFPNHKKNKYLEQMSIKERIMFELISRKYYWLFNVLLRLKKRIYR